MSYDLRVYVKAETPRLNGDPYVVCGIPEYDSPTYNLRPMFVACTGWEYKQGEVYHVPEVIGYIMRGVSELRGNPELYRQYDSPNGWGTLESALESLESLLACIQECSGDWPLDALYMSW